MAGKIYFYCDAQGVYAKFDDGAIERIRTYATAAYYTIGREYALGSLNLRQLAYLINGVDVVLENGERHNEN